MRWTLTKAQEVIFTILFIELQEGLQMFFLSSKEVHPENELRGSYKEFPLQACHYLE